MKTISMGGTCSSPYQWWEMLGPPQPLFPPCRGGCTLHFALSDGSEQRRVCWEGILITRLNNS